MSTGSEIKVVFPGGKRVDAQVGEFVVRTDQPVSVGGDGSAPAPFLLFLSSLATCAGIYVLGFCQNRGLSTDGITLTQRMGYGPSAVPGQYRLSQIEIDVEVPASFPEKYRSVLVKVAEKCAVKETIQDPPEFVVRTVVKE